jgi:methanogenic corrinoid protein MtbC1
MASKSGYQGNEDNISDSRMNDLIAAILEGDSAESASQAQHLLGCGISPEHIVVHGVEVAMSALDAKCTLEQFNLLEIMLAGRAVTEVMKVIYPVSTAIACTKGTIVIATLEGDVHDLGKNILKIVLIAKGYRVVDCGKDCPLQKLIEVAETERPIAIGVSGMITPIIPLVKQVKDQLALRGLDQVKIVAGGAALKQSSSDKLNVDFVAESAFDGLHYLEELRGGGK